ncbi:cytochrome P450 [Pyrrhoderma noxium]|uniref:Cytochrome P450 n=1 Tax=Pyrrhoderma noxium TaxID=2282107 RepID=A0A286U6Z0_9AGAM|nr:cytochrome P450 [Pyrrhoderma noxium]
MLPHGIVAEIRDAVYTVAEVSTQVLNNKSSALEKGDEAMENMAGKGKDILSVLRSNPNNYVTSSTLIFAATDTTTSAVSRVLSILAEHQDIQTQVREEVTAARQTYGDLDYDTLQSLPLLDAVCRETLRLYAPVPNASRVALKDAVLPLLWPIKSADGGSEIKEIFVPKGTDVVIAIMGANKSKKIWGEDAEEWKPSRWLNPLPESIQKAHLPGVYSQM